MDSRPLVVGVLRCIRPWALDSRIAKHRFRCRIGAAIVEVVVPTYQRPDEILDMDDLAASQSKNDEPLPAHMLAEVLEAASADEFPREPFDAESARALPQMEVRRLVLCASEPEEGLPPPRDGVADSLVARVADELRANAERWYDLASSWIEIYTEQDLDHEHPRYDAWVEGGALGTFDRDGRRTRASGRLQLTMHDETPASPTLFARAVAWASEGTSPPLPHLLLRDARGALTRAAFRRAVIDAAVAAEVAMAQVAAESEMSLPGRPSLRVYVKALHNADLISAEQKTLLQKKLVNLRNDVAHRGAVSSSRAAMDAVYIATATVRQFSPLPSL